jgi:hypothetical protein
MDKVTPKDAFEANRDRVAPLLAKLKIVIPGRDKVASPESITTIVSMDSGPAPRGASRNDEPN